MRLLFQLAALFSVLLLSSCSSDHSANQDLPINSNATQQLSKTIIIQPFSDFPTYQLSPLVIELKKSYASVQLNSAIPLPSMALNYNKTRYRADSLIHYLSKQIKGNTLVIGLTTKDISTTKGQFADWGIFGLGYCPGNACIASNFRLKGNNKNEKLLKVALHELAHTAGLKHCLQKSCLMRDAEGKDHLDEETAFCSMCKSRLIKYGWNLK